MRVVGYLYTFEDGSQGLNTNENISERSVLTGQTFKVIKKEPVVLESAVKDIQLDKASWCFRALEAEKQLHDTLWELEAARNDRDFWQSQAAGVSW